jgi:hypothetical protein
MLSDFVFHKICNIGSVIPCFFEHLENNLQKSVFLLGNINTEYRIFVV